MPEGDGTKRSFQNDASPSGRDRREGAKDAGSVRSSATDATEDEGSLRPARTRRPGLHSETSSKYGKYVISDLIMPESKQKIDAEYRKYAERILWLDDKMVPGTFHMNTAWYLKAGPTLEDKPHVHDTDEIIGFFGSDPENPHDLNGEVEIWLDDEKHVIDRTTMIFVPAGLVHCPLVLNRVDKPIFHFTTVNGGQYKLV